MLLLYVSVIRYPLLMLNIQHQVSPSFSLTCGASFVRPLLMGARFLVPWRVLLTFWLSIPIGSCSGRRVPADGEQDDAASITYPDEPVKKSAKPAVEQPAPQPSMTPASA